MPDLEVTLLPLSLPRLPAEFHGYRLAQISDIHVDGRASRPPLDEIVDRVNQARPDLVALTGDLVSRRAGRHAEKLADALGRLSAPDGGVAVLGNHDHGAGAEQVRAILRQAGLIDLSNAALTLRRGQACLHLAGVDDPMNGMDRLDVVLEALPAEGAAILLCHVPDFADASAASRRFDLQISGHTHGGQIRLPGIGPLFLPRLGRKYPAGLYRVGEMLQYTNRGVGMAHLPVRFRCPAEITLFELVSPAVQGGG